MDPTPTPSYLVKLHGDHGERELNQYWKKCSEEGRAVVWVWRQSGLNWWVEYDRPQGADLADDILARITLLFTIRGNHHVKSRIGRAGGNICGLSETDAHRIARELSTLLSPSSGH